MNRLVKILDGYMQAQEADWLARQREENKLRMENVRTAMKAIIERDRDKVSSIHKSSVGDSEEYEGELRDRGVYPFVD